MKQCPVCGYTSEKTAMRCPECGEFYSPIIKLIDQAAKEEERQSFKGRCLRIIKADSKRQALGLEFEQFRAGLPLMGKIALWMIFAFVFALIVSVL